jgi:hypothetical protein
MAHLIGVRDHMRQQFKDAILTGEPVFRVAFSDDDQPTRNETTLISALFHVAAARRAGMVRDGDELIALKDWLGLKGQLDKVGGPAALAELLDGR